MDKEQLKNKYFNTKIFVKKVRKTNFPKKEKERNKK